jgi:hypothetical protein
MVNITQEDLDSMHAEKRTASATDIYNSWISSTSNKINKDSIRPDHYGGKDNVYEVFNVLEAWNLDKDFYLGNVIKYIRRCELKDPTKVKEDLQKAMVYLQRKIDRL